MLSRSSICTFAHSLLEMEGEGERGMGGVGGLVLYWGDGKFLKSPQLFQIEI